MKLSIITQWLKSRLSRCCVLCTQYHQRSDALCSACHEWLQPTAFSCDICATPLPPSQFLTCGSCIRKKPNFDYVIAPYPFEEPLRTLLHEFKYRQGLYLNSYLAKLIMQHLPPAALQTQCLIPVPIHRKKLIERGFNQAAELTKYLGKTLGIPYQLDACQKIIHTLPQAGLNATQRKRNLTQAFAAEALPFQHITLIDDLLTTGSTVNELAKIFKRQGVARVDVWCCARASIKGLH